MEFHELAPEQQAKIKGDHPEFDSYAPNRKALAIKDRLKKDSRNTRLTTGKAEEAKSSLNVDANPLGYHKALYKSNEALDKIANDHPNQDAMRSVFNHTDQARSSLAAHWDAHNKGNTEEAAGHLQAAAGHISNAAVAYHIVAGIPGGTDEISKHVKNVANGYKYNEAGGKAPQVKQARPDMRLTNLANQREADAAAEDKAWRKADAESDKKLAPRINRVTPVQQESKRREDLNLSRQIRAAGGSVSEGLESRKFNTPAVSGRVEDNRTGSQKYLGQFGAYSPRGGAGVPKINREIFKAHAQDAIEAMNQGKPVPEETKAALGKMGMEAVHKNRRNVAFSEGQEK
jgi:hypothetical protein